MKWKTLFIIIGLFSILAASCSPQTATMIITQSSITSISTPTLPPTDLPSHESTPNPRLEYIPKVQGFSPHAFVLTRNGEFAYIGFDLSEIAVKVRLSDLSVTGEADLSAYFPIESEDIVLNESETKLFVYSPTWRTLIVLDTESMSIIHTIPDISIIHMVLSTHAPYLITWDGGSAVRYIDTETYAITEATFHDKFFVFIQETPDDPSQWFVVSGNPSEGYKAGLFENTTGTWRMEIPILMNSQNEGLMDFKALPGLQKAYLASFGGWNQDFSAYGWLYSIDLVKGEVISVPIDGGAFCLETSTDNQMLFVGTGWPAQEGNNLLVINTATNEVVAQVPMGLTSYGWRYTQMNHLQSDPAHSQFLYGTNTDANTFFKVNMDGMVLDSVMMLNQEIFHPHLFIRQPGSATGLILLEHSPFAIELDIDQGIAMGTVEFPNIRQDAGAYGVAFTSDREILVAQGEFFLLVDKDSMGIIETIPLSTDTPSIWNFSLSRKEDHLYAITYDPDGIADIFLALDPVSLQVQASISLDGGNFNFITFELPDSSKLYALGGRANGAVVLHVIETENFSIVKTITFDDLTLAGISGGPYYPFAFDPDSQTLFAGTTQAVLAIDVEMDEIKKVIPLEGAARAIGLEPWQLTYINAVGLVFNPQENYLYIAHLDRSFISTYDLGNDRYLDQVIPLHGYFPQYLFTNDDFGKIYSVNRRSDSVSIIDVREKRVTDVIDLHSILSEP